MLVIEDVVQFLKKKGFRDTYKVLTSVKNYKVEKHAFYNELNKFSYYNSFFRVKDDLIEKGLIQIEQNGNKKYIKLTEKGLTIYKKLVELNELINHHNGNK